MPALPILARIVSVALPLWILLLIIAIPVVFVLGLAAIALVCGLLEKSTADGKAHLESAAMPPAPATLSQLTAAGLEVVQTGLDRTSSLANNHVWVLASPDRTALASIDKTRLGTTTTFLSRRRDGVWLVTKMALGIPSPRQRRALFDALQGDTIEATLALHRVRLADEPQDLQRFDPEAAAAALEQAKRAYYEDLIDAGVARWTDLAQNTAKLTLKGAILSALNTLMLPVIMSRYAKRKPIILARAATLPPLRPLPTSAAPAPAPGIQGTVPDTLPEQLVVITSTRPGAQNDYMPYHVDGKSYLPVFADELQAMAYSGLYPAGPGETRQLLKVARPWLASCLGLGYELVLHPHMAGRRTITAAELGLPASPPAAG